jgi:L-histidine Nalpha-methyltransferase
MPNDSLVRSADATLVSLALQGLSRRPKTLPAKLFYDEQGCRLFYRITELPEYYLTRTELTLLRRFASDIAAMVEAPAALIEYGASDETKAEFLLGQTDKLGRAHFVVYVPVDVATESLAQMAARLRQRRPELAVFPIAADFTSPVTLPSKLGNVARLGFFPGSTIGNLDPPEARRFLAQARHTLGPGARMLVGVDLRKDPAILVPAYDDADGVTAAFNLNLLARLNREADADFDLRRFVHRAVWNDRESRIEMHLESCCDQLVHLDSHAIRFVAGETIHTENSYKHTVEGFARLAERAGWRVHRVWTDPARLFSMHLLTIADGRRPGE